MSQPTELTITIENSTDNVAQISPQVGNLQNELADPFDVASLSSIDAIRTFINSRCNSLIYFDITRLRMETSNSLDFNIKSNVYNLNISDQSLNKRVLLHAKRKTKYIHEIFLNQEFETPLMTISGNILGTVFTIFENGIEVAIVCYKLNVLRINGPREMEVIIPFVDSQITTNSAGNLFDAFKQLKKNEYLVMKSKNPVWNEAIQAYVLNLGDRVTESSVKNFQIINEHDREYIVLQFGKVGKDEFTMDVQYPLTPILGFAISLTSLIVKLGCE